MKEIALEFRLAQIRHPDDPEQTPVGWLMQMTGKIEGIGHVVRSHPSVTYPSRRETAAFFSRATRQVREWFDSPEYAAALQRTLDKRRRLIVVPGRG